MVHFKQQLIDLLLADIEVHELIPLAGGATKTERRRTGAGNRGENILIVDPVDVSQFGVADADLADDLALAQRNHDEIPALAVRPDKRKLGAVGRNGHIFQAREPAERLEGNGVRGDSGARSNQAGSGRRAGRDGGKERTQR